MDFAAGEDKIELDSSALTALVGQAGNALSEGNFHADAGVLGMAHSASHLVLYDTATGELYYDGDGAGVGAAPELLATLAGTPVIAAADILVV